MFTVTATTAAGSLTYQWQLNGTDLSGATTDTLTINNVQESDEGMYRCVVTNAAGMNTSTAAQLTVREWLCMCMTCNCNVHLVTCRMCLCRNLSVLVAMLALVLTWPTGVLSCTCCTGSVTGSGCTVVMPKSVHGWSTLQVYQRGSWVLFQVFLHLTAKECLCHVYSDSMQVVGQDNRITRGFKVES